MSEKSRTEERDDLLTGLGMLVDPIHRLMFETDDPLKMIPYVRSQFQQDLGHFRTQVTKYCRPGKHNFDREIDVILREAKRFSELLDEFQRPELWRNSRDKFSNYLKAVRTAIGAVPCEDVGVMLPAESPLQTYYRLRAICSNATERLELFDPYLDADVFHRYLRETSEKTYLRIITSENIMVKPQGQQGMRRRDEIIAISELVALERANSYGFYVTLQQHDRHLRVDNQIFHLGGSVKDASKRAPYTISLLDPTQSNHIFLDGLISGADEWFGPNVKTHRHS